MRALPVLALASLCACSSARQAHTQAPPPCGALPLLGAATPLALAADGAGGIALAGELASGSLRGGTASLDQPGGFVLRTDPAGEVAWIHGLGPARPLGIALTADGGAVVVGTALRRCFAARLDVLGRRRWATSFAGEGESACRAVAVDPRSGAIWAAGDFSGTAGRSRSSGPGDALLLSIAPETGEMRLARAFGGIGADTAGAIALARDEVIVGGSFSAPPDAQVDLGRGPIRAAGEGDGFLLAVAGSATRWVSIVGEYADDDVVAVAAADGQVYAAANVHRDRKGAPCGGEVVVLRNREWVRVSEEQCLSARGLALDDAGRLWTLENAGSSLRARAFSPRDGEILGGRSWSAARAAVRGAAIAAVPGGLAIAGTTSGELVACGKPLGSSGEQSAFVLWIRDL